MVSRKSEMNLAKRITLLGTAGLFVLSSVGVASAKDFVPEGPSLEGSGKVAFIVQDDRNLPIQLIRKDIHGQDMNKVGNQWCLTYTTETCRLEKGTTLLVNANLGLCKSDEDPCLEGLKIAKTGEELAPAVFERETTGTPLPANNLGAPIGGGTTIWRASGVPGETGTEQYAVYVSLYFHIIDGVKVEYKGVSATVSPVTELAGSSYKPGEVRSQMIDGVRWWLHDNGSRPGYDCFATDVGRCWMRENFSPGTRVELQMRLPNTLSGWLHGRLSDTDLNISAFNEKLNKVSVSAEPVVLPVMFATVDEKQKSKRINDILKMDTSTGGGGGSGKDALAWKIYESDTHYTRELVSYFANEVNDRAVATQTAWRLKTIWSNTGNRCLDERGKLIGLVTTNALTYEGGPPRFQNGFLNYSTAGLHELPSGEEALGSYNLLIRSETARCLYGFSKAPVNASITVSGEGDRTIATTVVGEKNGWLKLAAYGFTFSEKTIKVKITQPKRTTITCVTTTKPSRVKNVTGTNPKCPSGFKRR